AVSPAADANALVAPYSSGEVTAIRVENGRPLWQDNLASVRRSGALSGLSDIRGLPVIDRGLVFAVSHSGRTVAIDERTGARVWEAEIGGVNTPWPAGDYLFLVSNDNELVALQRETGHIRWAKPLERLEDPENKKSTPVVWAGPVMAGDRLWLVGSNETLISLSPADGAILSTLELPHRSYLAPVVAKATLYVLTDDGTLVAYR
ncbi:MAG: PQQ-binding-like beta-propeller repeat protein, partial [Rhodospirillaceae bacterium]